MEKINEGYWEKRNIRETSCQSAMRLTDNEAFSEKAAHVIKEAAEGKYFEYPIYDLPTAEGEIKKKFCNAVFKEDGIYMVRKDRGQIAEIPYEYVEGQIEIAKIAYRNYRKQHPEQ